MLQAQYTTKSIVKDNTSERWDWIDLARGIGIILMIIGHAHVFPTLKIWIYSFHMPLFFIISGITGRLSDEKRGRENEPFFKFFLRKIRRYIGPYCLFFLINLFVVVLRQFIQQDISGYMIADYFWKGLVLSYDESMPNCDPIWFLTCLFVSELICFFLKKIKRKGILGAIIFLQILLLQIVLYVEQMCGIRELPWHIDVALVASVFIMLGRQAHVILELMKKKRFVLFAFITGSIIGVINGRVNMVTNEYCNFGFFLMSSCLISFSVIYMIKQYCISGSGIHRLIKYWGRNSIFFLGFNYFFNSIVNIFLRVLKIDNGVLYSLIDIIAVLFGTSIVIYSYTKIKTILQMRKKSNVE